MNIYQKYLAKEQEIKRNKIELEDLQAELYTKFQDGIKTKEEEGGTFSVNDQGYKFKCEIKFTYKIEDKKKAEEYLNKGCKAFKNEVKFSKTGFKNLDIDEQENVLSMMSVKQAKPTFKVEANNED